MSAELTVDGAMLILNTPMRQKVSNALMSVMTHGIVVTNLIPLHAAQAGLVMRSLDNALQPTLVMDLVANLNARTTAEDTNPRPHIDATLLVPYVIHAQRMIRDVTQTEQLSALIASQIQANFTDATRPIQTNQSAKNVTQRMLLTATKEP